MGVLIGCHGNSITGATDNHTPLHFATINSITQLMSEVGIVDTLFTIGAEVIDLGLSKPLIEEILNYLFDLKASVVAS